MIKKIVNAIKHFFNGVYSGIPICCCLFFAKTYYKSGKMVCYNVLVQRGYNIKLETIGMSYMDDNEYAKMRKYEYVPCDSCHTKNKVVEIKDNGVIFRVD